MAFVPQSSNPQVGFKPTTVVCFRKPEAYWRDGFLSWRAILCLYVIASTRDPKNELSSRTGQITPTMILLERVASIHAITMVKSCFSFSVLSKLFKAVRCLFAFPKSNTQKSPLFARQKLVFFKSVTLPKILGALLRYSRKGMYGMNSRETAVRTIQGFVR